jgi:hypothetical protein
MSTRSARAIRWRAAGILAACVTAGCSDSAARTPAASADVEVVDSAGVVSIRFVDLTGAALPTFDLATAYSTGDGGPDLYRAVAARLLPDGGVLIANAGAHEVLLLDGAGRLVRRFGGEGDGPGEFRGLSALFVTDSTTLVAYDARLARLTEFRMDGSVLSTRRLAPDSRVVDLQPLALTDDGGVLAVLGDIRMFGRSGISRDSTPLMHFDAAGGAPDTLGYWKVTEYNYVSTPEAASRRPVGFGRDAAWAGRNGSAVIGTTDAIDLTVFDSRGNISRRITSGGTPAPVTASALRLWREDLQRAAGRMPESFQRAILDTPARDTYPAFDALVIDDQARVWIGLYPVPGEPARRWIIVDADGTAHGSVQVPSSARILDAADGRIALLLRSELDEQFLAVMSVK